MTSTKKQLGNLIKEARKLKSNKIKKKYTQKMLAADIGKSQSYIGDIESGRTYPNFTILNKISKACEVSISFFKTGDTIDGVIDKFIKLQLDDVEEEDIYKIREEIKKDPDIKLNHIYDYVKNSGNQSGNVTLESNSNISFKTPKEAIKFILRQTVVMDYCGIDTNKMSEEDLNEFTNDILNQIKLISYKYKR